MDESYRKAGKLDTNAFATPFDVHSTGLMDVIVEDLLADADMNRRVYAELYKLNVYGRITGFRCVRLGLMDCFIHRTRFILQTT